MTNSEASVTRPVWKTEDDYDDDEFRDNKPHMIEKGLYLGSLDAERQKGKLQQVGVTHILQVLSGTCPTHPEDFTYLQVPVADEPHTDIVAHFNECFDYIQKAVDSGGAVLVHCLAGISRSASVCIGYLMWKHKWSYRQAFDTVKSARRWVNPNYGFVWQLREYERLEFDLSRWQAAMSKYRVTGTGDQNTDAILVCPESWTF